MPLTLVWVDFGKGFVFGHVLCGKAVLGGLF